MTKLLALVVLALVLFGALVAWVELDEPIRTVSVEGRLERAERDAIKRVVVDSLPGGILSVDLPGLQQEILALSWPRHVTIRRLWPDGLLVIVEKEVLIAAWQDAYLNTEGKIVHWPSARKGLPTFDCRLCEPRVAMEIYLRLSAAASVQGLYIDRLAQDELGVWAVTFANGMKVLLGTERLTQRLERFLVVYEHRLAARNNEVDQVDARYANGVAVRWRETLPVRQATLAVVGRTNGDG